MRVSMDWYHSVLCAYVITLGLLCLKVRDKLGDPGIAGRIISKWILNKRSLSWLRIESITDFYEQGNEPSGSVKYQEFLHYLSDHHLLKKHSTQKTKLIRFYCKIPA